MDIFLIILAGICMIVGLLGSVLPVLPGVPISYMGILLLHFTHKYQFSSSFLIIWGSITIAVMLLDTVLPVFTTKKFGGSKAGVRGSVAGMLIGLFLGPWGIITGPFLGALIGELLAGKQTRPAIKAALGSFAGFLIGTLSKLIVSAMMLYYFVHTLI